MSPIILISIYLALSALAAVMTERCLRRWEYTRRRAARLRGFWLTPYVLLSLLPVAGAFLPDGALKFRLQEWGNVWLGFYLYYGWILFMLLAAAEIPGLFGRGREGRLHGAALIASAAATLVLAGYGLWHAQDTVVTRMDLTLDRKGGEAGDVKLVLIGDLHLGVNSRLSSTERMVELINAEEPDAVVIAGDVFTSSYRGLREPEKYAAALRGIRARSGVFAVYGNHDMEETLFGGFPISPVSRAFRTAEMEAFFKDCGFRTLTDETVRPGPGWQLCGRVDGEKAGDGTTNRMSAAELLSHADAALPVLVLQHEPKEFAALREAGADAVLCGHTHAGQIFPGNLIVPLFNENAYGYVNADGLHTVVTSGVGCYGPPMRIGTNSEVMVIRLHFR